MHADGCPTKELAKLLWLNKVGEPSDHPDHQITYDHDIVEICPSCSGATIERLRHDCFDFEEVWDQYEWYELAPEDGARLREVAARCDQALNPFCKCATHESLRKSLWELPSSSWDAIFETAAHRHQVRLTAVGKPRFVLVAKGVAAPAQPKADDGAKPKEPDTKGVLFIFVAWPAVYIAFAWAWLKFVPVPWYVDAIALFVAVPVTFVVAGAVLALGSVIAKPSKPS